MRETAVSRALQFAAAFAIVLGITIFYRKVLPVNATTVALTFLLAILAVSTFWGIAVSVFMSVVAMLAFNYYFLPPVGTLTIADPQNWVALLAFLVTSIMGSQLSARIRKEADEAHQRRREIERLYKFSQKLLAEGNVIQLMNAIPNYIVESFEGGAAEQDQRQQMVGQIFRAGTRALDDLQQQQENAECEQDVTERDRPGLA